MLEIGFGRGDTTAVLAAADPDRDVLAVEAHLPGVGSLLLRLEEAGLSNVRVVEGDAAVLLRDMLSPASLAEVRIWFPDPWPKARHAKRRLVQPPFLELLASRLHAGGVLHFASDAADYVDRVHASCAASHDFSVISRERPRWRPVTGFEQRARDAGRASYDVLVRRVVPSGAAVHEPGAGAA